MTLRRGAAIETLERRAELLARTRAWFAARNVLEVETATLTAAATPDPALHSLRTKLGTNTAFLHTSPEYMMKRLIAGGSGDIWQLCRVYRDGELGRWHEPEFTLLEWYRVGFDEHELMTDVDALLGELLGRGRLRVKSARIRYDAALMTALGLTSQADSADIAAALRQHGVDVPQAMPHSGLLDLAISTVVSDRFSRDGLTFLYDYPASQAALARINPGAASTAARFEVFLGGLELGNGFCELTDAGEQRARFEAENRARIGAGLEAVPLDEAFLEAVGGMPQCAGVAVGFDRVVATALNADSLSDVVAFTHAAVSP